MENNIKIEKRIEKLRKSLFEKQIDCYMVLSEENRYYFSDFKGEDTTFYESAGCLLITDKSLILATDSRYELEAKNEAPLYEVCIYKEGLPKEMPKLIKMLDIKKIGFEGARLSIVLCNKIIDEIKKANLNTVLIEADELLDLIREIKDEQEIELIKKSLFLAESVFKDASNLISTDITEKEFSWIMEKKMREAGASSMAFPPIVASGPNGALPHAKPTDRLLKEFEPIIIDWGLKLNSYCSDITRTVLIGEKDDTFKRVYDIVSFAQKKATQAIRAGSNSKEIDNIARSYISDNGFGDNFGHSLGHGVGLAVHEGPRLSPFRETILKPGMVFTVEPGIYIPGWGGIRLENMVAVTDDGSIILNTI
ncbi:MAG: aminopeptidase P family protein [Desulfobacterales bacterium]|nr:aminopeptidase P family protein [Desulfobacterales bacterium]